MAGALQLRKGTKLNMAIDTSFSEDANFEYICTFARAIDESAFLISVPMKGGQPLDMDFTRKLLFKYNVGSEVNIVAGYADDEVKEGIRHFWKIRRVQEQRQFFQRADARYKVALHVTFLQDNWERDDNGNIIREDGMTLDISSGGMAVFMNRSFDIGEILFFQMPRVGTSKEGNLTDELPAVVCWMRESPKGSSYARICGLQFKFSDNSEKAILGDYITYVRQRYKLV